jgi:hypothetical protein
LAKDQHPDGCSQKWSKEGNSRKFQITAFGLVSREGSRKEVTDDPDTLFQRYAETVSRYSAISQIDRAFSDLSDAAGLAGSSRTSKEKTQVFDVKQGEPQVFLMLLMPLSLKAEELSS